MTEDERADEELELKRQTLALEQNKFRYAKILGFRERVGNATTRTASALMVANASSLIFSLSYYKQLAETVTKQIIGYSTTLFLFGLLFYMICFIDAAYLSIGDSELSEPSAKSGGRSIVSFRIFALISLVCFMLAIGIPVNEIYIVPDLSWLKNLTN